MTAVARDAFGGTVLWPFARASLFAVFVAVCLAEVAELLPGWVTRGIARGAPAAGAALWSLAGRAWRAVARALAPKRPPSPWVRRTSWAWDVVFGGAGALYLLAWFGVLLAAAAYARGPQVGLRCLAAGYAVAALVMARAFWNTALDGWHRLRHAWD